MLLLVPYFVSMFSRHFLMFLYDENFALILLSLETVVLYMYELFLIFRYLFTYSLK